MNAFFKAQFSYYPLVWMCHCRLMNNKINRLKTESLLKTPIECQYNDKTSYFVKKIDSERYISVSIHPRNLVLATEMFKLSKKIVAYTTGILELYPAILDAEFWNGVVSKSLQ